MEKDKKTKQKLKTTDEKINNMRSCVEDKEKCKIIAKQLTQYILKKD